MPTPSSARNPTRWVGLPAEERQAERRALLLDAALELLGTEGWAGTSVRAVCQAARLNPRYFYESFADLDALIVAVYDRLVEELGAAVVTAMAAAGDDGGAQVRAALNTILEYVEADPRRGRVLYVEALGSESLNRRRIETAHTLVSVVERGGAERAGPMGGDPIGRITAAILVGGAGELVVTWLDGTLKISRQQLVDDATELFIALGEAAGAIVARRA